MITGSVTAKPNQYIVAPVSDKSHYTAEQNIFALSSPSGGLLSDKITKTPATVNINGVHYGVINDAVTQFVVNQPPIEDDGLRGCPAFTQLAKMTETLTDAAWAKNEITVSLHTTFQGVNVFSLVETTSTSVPHNINQGSITSIADNSVLGICNIVKYKGRLLEIHGRLKDGSFDIVCIFNLQTGEISGLRSGSFASCKALSDGYYRVFASLPVGSGATDPAIYAQLRDGANNTYTGDGVSGVYLGRPTIINFGVNGVPFIPPYVPNNTNGSISVVSEAATATTGTSFDLDDVKLTRLKSIMRGPNAQGHVEFKLKLNFNRAWKTTNTPILSINNDATGDFLYYSVAGNLWSTFDTSGNRSQIVMSSFDVGQIVEFAVDFGAHSTGQKQRLTVNGVKSALGNFSGSWGSNDLRFFYNAGVHAGWIVKNSLKISGKPKW